MGGDFRRNRAGLGGLPQTQIGVRNFGKTRFETKRVFFWANVNSVAFRARSAINKFMNIMGRTIIFAALAALLAGCESRETAVADFANENLAYVGKNAAVSPDGKSCAIDTTKIPLKSYLRVVEFKNGTLKPDTRYVLKMSVKISDAEDGAYLHTLVRNTAAYCDGTDILKHNTYAYDKLPQTVLKFKTQKNAAEYALVFTAYKKLKAEISNIEIAEDTSIGFIPINGNVRHYKLDKSKLPRNRLPAAIRLFVSTPHEPVLTVVSFTQAPS